MLTWQMFVLVVVIMMQNMPHGADTYTIIQLRLYRMVSLLGAQWQSYNASTPFLPPLHYLVGNTKWVALGSLMMCLYATTQTTQVPYCMY